jgi:hypothetical protein
MKECPTCSRVYADESLRFCLDDGAPLISQARAAGAQPTIRINPPRTRSAKATEVLPGSRLTPHIQEQSLAPWLVAGAALLLVAVMGIGITILILANHQSSPSSPNSNGSSAGKNANSYKPPAADLTGTKWTQTSTISQMKEFNFLANGTINGDSGDTWKQNGTSLTMSITNGYAIYEGAISGDRIDYKAHNKVNLDWTGTLYRARSGPTP